MTDYNEKVYNIFDGSGRILQIEYALENINSSNLIVITKSDEKIVIITSRNTQEKLEIFENEHIHRITDTCYAAITGIPGDTDQVIDSLIRHASAVTEKYGFCTPDVLCRSFADKIQKITQESGTRAYAFSLVIFGFDDTPIIYNTDTSAVCYPYKAIAIGAKSTRVNKFLETASGDPIIIAVEAYTQVCDCNSGDMIVCYLEKGKDLKYLTVDELEPILNEIAEK
ncbi:putative proteasome subunit alpha type-4 [Dictyocoela muelleri]|nr:putative proteasome subunit alpha type-4 [Dictyocoela muelleri]